MEKHLTDIGFRHFRVRGVTPHEIYIPPDIESTWRTAKCKLQTEWIAPDKLSSNYSYSNNGNNLSKKKIGSLAEAAASPEEENHNRHTIYTSALCGRGKNKNTPKELGCTTSHLIAMYQAIYSTTATSRYALIVEDDVFFPFAVDYDSLAASAPSGFGILQLFNSNEGTLEETWRHYQRDAKYLWAEKQAKKYFDFWSTCAYLIDRVAMKAVIDQVIRRERGWFDVKIIAGINSPCVPRECCLPNTDQFQLQPPCVWAPRGYQADSYLYAMTKTYVLSVPIISNGLGGNQSTFHQDHVEMLHRTAFKRQREYINELYGTVTPPSFMKPACTTALDVNSI